MCLKKKAEHMGLKSDELKGLHRSLARGLHREGKKRSPPLVG